MKTETQNAPRQADRRACAVQANPDAYLAPSDEQEGTFEQSGRALEPFDENSPF